MGMAHNHQISVNMSVLYGYRYLDLSECLPAFYYYREKLDFIFLVVL